MLCDANGNLVHILLVEDSPTDVMLTKEAMEQYKVLNPLHIAEDGVEAMAYLKREGKYASAQRPGLIILDLNLPRKSGREVLRDLKSDPELMNIPVVILTTSKSEEDVAKSYGLHANCYITKPVDFEKFIQVVRSINDFWFGVVTLPPVKS
ncbi:response regulator [Trinickia caryophylli]|uniref:Response regulator receiver domain-containing protein n=1 Tax=Trinickia caryophylli TaxID=28094 RepID=A0A1X7CZL4_TRICW|nr:response regulator [Trinickia caryophylli]PMS13496.1 response regulator [Trinickia caryophylli]TRX11211.1 response regulator [Trinickia caryophylli]TRX11220.1 response regulator [Trinickia caryophylli]TRX13645.1 response regulator [Trinickia caryophylli]WQE15225.1 response regulator [Trinickia caryophylli]